ncbi:MAG: hypothetical protein KJN76_07455 [Eudoraea sp.]|nr:hypothetical protein [Eudoraea sp.]
MRNAIYIVMSGILSLQGCSSQKKLESSAPFTIDQATCQEWVGGKEESGTGFLLQLPLTAADSDDIEFKEVFFRGAIMETEVERADDKITLVCNFFKEKKVKPDIIMHADAKKEVGNQPPRLPKKGDEFPFELKPDEAVISYTASGSNKLKYIKIGGIVDKPSRIYRGRPQN